MFDRSAQPLSSHLTLSITSIEKLRRNLLMRFLDEIADELAYLKKLLQSGFSFSTTMQRMLIFLANHAGCDRSARLLKTMGKR